jgi:hypothetical protein
MNAGIDPAKFQEVQHAYDVLSDPERRRRYDAGEDDVQAKPVNTVEVRARTVVKSAVMAVLSAYTSKLPNLAFTTLVMKEVTEMIAMVKEEGRGAVNTRGEAAKIRAVLRKLKRRAKGEDDLLIPILNDEIARIEARAAAMDEDNADKLAVMNRAAELIKAGDYSYDFAEQATYAEPFYHQQHLLGDIFGAASRVKNGG